VPPLAYQGQRVVDGRGQVEGRQLELHLPRLDLREIEDVVDEGQKVLPRGVNILQVLVLLRVQLAEHPLAQHLREADDRVERRAQLMRHVGEEFGLVATRRLELPTLDLDLAEQPCVLNRQGRLGGEGS
jgi:hypothetical protein